MIEIVLFTLIAAVVGGAAAYFASKKKVKEYEEIMRGQLADLTWEELKDIRAESIQIATRQMADPAGSGISRKEGKKNILIAIWVEDRMNELKRKDCGAVFRAKRKISLLKELHEAADGMAKK